MPEDWAAVARAITERVSELGWQQRQLAERSHVSQAIVRELQHHTVERRRSPRTLTALSTALEWHPEHLASVLHGQSPMGLDATITTAVPRAVLDERLDNITHRLDALQTDVTLLVEHFRASR